MLIAQEEVEVSTRTCVWPRYFQQTFAWIPLAEQGDTAVPAEVRGGIPTLPSIMPSTLSSSEVRGSFPPTLPSVIHFLSTLFSAEVRGGIHSTLPSVIHSLSTLSSAEVRGGIPSTLPFYFADPRSMIIRI